MVTTAVQLFHVVPERAAPRPMRTPSGSIRGDVDQQAKCCEGGLMQTS
jgi:hypothetical protein